MLLASEKPTGSSIQTTSTRGSCPTISGSSSSHALAAITISTSTSSLARRLRDRPRGACDLCDARFTEQILFNPPTLWCDSNPRSLALGPARGVLFAAPESLRRRPAADILALVAGQPRRRTSLDGVYEEGIACRRHAPKWHFGFGRCPVHPGCRRRRGPTPGQEREERERVLRIEGSALPSTTVYCCRVVEPGIPRGPCPHRGSADSQPLLPKPS